MYISLDTRGSWLDRLRVVTHGEFYADKLMDLANLVGATLVFGQLITGKIYWIPFVIGTSFFWSCLVISLWLRKGGAK